MASTPGSIRSKNDINARIMDLGVKAALTALLDDINGVNSGGTNAVATVVSTEQAGLVHQTTLTLTNVPMTISDTNVGGGVKIFTFPVGRISLLGALATVAFTTTSVLDSTLNASVTGNYGLGTVITAAQASGTLATTQQDVVPTTNFTASATINVAGAAANGVLAAAAQFDGTTTPVPVHLNVGIATATDIDGDATVLANGTVVLTWINLGDI